MPQQERYLGNQADPMLAPHQPESLQELATYLSGNIREKSWRLEQQGKQVDIYGPDWCRENADLAGQLHADMIVATYGSTYALPNKDPEANRVAIEQGSLDVYLMAIDDRVTGTACLVNMGDGRAELGRSASLGKSSNTIIQDLRILDWLTNPETAEKYHTLFTTLRSAPDRFIDEPDGEFVMRGGQAVTEHWRKFPGLVVNGFGPLYLKHGMLEQFTLASLSRNRIAADRPLYIDDESHRTFVAAWHEEYDIETPAFTEASQPDTELTFQAHYPPQESGLTGFVHADIVISDHEGAGPLVRSLEEVEMVGSPFTQIVLPVDVDTRSVQAELKAAGYKVFGYQPATDGKDRPSLVLGKLTGKVQVVPTHWDHAGTPNPFWKNPVLIESAAATARSW